MTRQYHVVVINERTGAKAYMTAEPVTHEEGCTILRKLTKYTWRREQLEEVQPVAYDLGTTQCYSHLEAIVVADQRKRDGYQAFYNEETKVVTYYRGDCSDYLARCGLSLH